ncbi:hypothetical protein DNK47_01245 [Mycoplasma wenyonii]|uniref:Uncharacterized protein n=1 Tax=Mycoplasma wenyonii TaxID=65123 RepID=A0A328PUY0_9MOLU|nr:hypothetical protein [Mycoplasma wenyonii]RAO95231.1 hypothetical protein DNK47_01245 [Mycoplasma wenyonii]
MKKGAGDVSLEWIAELSDKKNDLIKGQGVTVDTKVSLKWKGQDWKWWDPIKNHGPGNLWVSTNRGGGLSLTIRYDVARGGYMGESRGMSMSCRDSGATVRKDSGGNRIYSLSTRARTGHIYDQVDTGQKLGINVSLKSCEVKEKEIECSLNIVTGSDLNWSTKVKQKANVTFSL